jgi:YbgC/YbaW family acyl-CoA thioester hydrolase
VSGPDGLKDPARVRIRRRIEWMDTDAAGIYHWSTAFRLAEAAEAEMHTALGIADRTFGATPRVSVAADFRRPLRFNDPVDVELFVQALGRSSVTYRLLIESERGTAVEGRITSVLVDRESGRALPWPEDLRHALGAGGAQSPTG